MVPIPVFPSAEPEGQKSGQVNALTPITLEYGYKSFKKSLSPVLFPHPRPYFSALKPSAFEGDGRGAAVLWVYWSTI